MSVVRLIIPLCIFIASFSIQALPIQDYLPENVTFNPETPLPSSTLGFEIGERHMRHDQLKQYFYRLDNKSERVKITSIGKTPQWREQFLVTISSPENLTNLDSILARRHIPLTNKKNKDEPLVIWLGYSVHGDEITGANAAMVVAYYLAASQEKSIKDILANTIIVLEPSINPDGMDRFANWVTTYRGTADNSDPNHAEHHQGWVSGRTNHFWFDLNRDWLLISQQETRHRLKYFHLYQPNVLGDYHEMQTNSSYFFQPGILSRTNPLTPKKNILLTSKLAKYHAKALDKAQRLYYSEESFDDFYYGKGSTYPDIQGSLGILFEQASSRGMQVDSSNGLLTLEYGIQNHVLTSLSTIEGAWDNRKELTEYRHDYYQQALKEAKNQKIDGYLITENKDSYRLHKFLNTLSQHQINVYQLSKNFDYDKTTYYKDSSYFIPLVQEQYGLIQALFSQRTDFPDNTFYDVSGWTMPLAMNIHFKGLDSTWGLELSKKPWDKTDITKVRNTSNEPAYAYAFEWHNFLAPKLLNQLLENDINAKVATGGFVSEVSGKDRLFAPGTIVIPAAIQNKENWVAKLVELSNKNNLEIVALNSGLTSQGIDIGSSSFKVLTQPKVLLLGGAGISQYEAGEIRYYLDEQLSVPVSVIEHSRLDKVDIDKYTHVILVDGSYSKINEKVTNKLTTWVDRGGVIIGQKRAAKWLAKQEVLSAKIANKKQLDNLFDSENLSYQEKDTLASRKRIAGAIFETKLDTSHPLAFGYEKNTLPLFRNSTIIMDAGQQPFITLAQYSAKPLLSGYTDKNLVNKLANNAAIIAHNYGQGRVIATSDVLAFRGYWLGSAKLLANSLFFGKFFYAPVDN